MTQPVSSSHAVQENEEKKGIKGIVPALRSKLRGTRGDSHLVAIIIVICVTVGLCSVFRNQLYTLFTSTIFPALGNAAQGFLNYTGA